MVSAPTWQATSFYQFLPLSASDLPEIRANLEQWMSAHGVTGLVIFAVEGVNGTVAGSHAEIADFKSYVESLIDYPNLRYKDSESDRAPFHRTSVVIRPEIVSLKRPDLVPRADEDHHLSPKEWHDLLESDKPKLVVDTRNDYETAIGKFRGALDPGLKTFSEWSQYLQETELPKDVPVLIYCTGGIRCEKALQEMRAHGYEEVYQLRDGILGYLAEYPEGHFEGECFVFDDRVALTADLKPTAQYGICPGCGQPGDQVRTCSWCEKQYFGCQECDSVTCSKTCSDRVGRHGSRVPLD